MYINKRKTVDSCPELGQVHMKCDSVKRRRCIQTSPYIGHLGEYLFLMRNRKLFSPGSLNCQIEQSYGTNYFWHEITTTLCNVFTEQQYVLIVLCWCSRTCPRGVCPYILQLWGVCPWESFCMFVISLFILVIQYHNVWMFKYLFMLTLFIIALTPAIVLLRYFIVCKWHFIALKNR